MTRRFKGLFTVPLALNLDPVYVARYQPLCVLLVYSLAGRLNFEQAKFVQMYRYLDNGLGPVLFSSSKGLVYGDYSQSKAWLVVFTSGQLNLYLCSDTWILGWAWSSSALP